MGKPDVTIDIGALMTKEVIYKGSFRYGVSFSVLESTPAH